MAFLILVLTVAADRSSEALISSVLYPACRATTWANVVLPYPGGPDNSRIYHQRLPAYFKGYTPVREACAGSPPGRSLGRHNVSSWADWLFGRRICPIPSAIP